jgi:hypothetical protein
VVIGREKKTPCYFHRCAKTVESSFISIFTSSFGILARAGTSEIAPVDPRAARQELSARVLLFLDRAGLSLIGAYGASEKCAKVPADFHTPCTVFPQALILCNCARAHQFSRYFSIISCVRVLISRKRTGLGLRKTCLILKFFCPAYRIRRCPAGRCR